MAEYYGAGEDAIYLSGIAAGAATKSGTVGYVVPFAIPEVIRHTNAFALGVQKAHPGREGEDHLDELVVRPAKEKKAAENLHAAGADVIGQNVDSPAAGQYAESAGMPWVGYDSNAQKFAPKSWLTAAVYNWGPYYLKRVKAAMNGTWKTGIYYGSLKDGFTLLAPYGKNVSAKTKALIAQQQALIKSGKWNEFSGPIYDQSGKLRVKKGQRLTFKRALRDQLARQGRHREPEGLDGRTGGRGRAAPPALFPCRPPSRSAGSRSGSRASSRTTASHFEAAEGEVHALLGENGAGKSTLSNILTGPLPPRRGRDPARRASRSRSTSPRDALDAGICMVHQHFRLVPPFTVAENVILGDHRGEGKKFVVHPRRIERRVAELGERYRHRRRSARADLAALARRAAARRDPEGALPRGAHPDPRRADRGADAAGGGRRSSRRCA